MSVIFTDIECYHDFFYIGFKREEDGKRVGVEFSSRSPEYDRRYVRSVLKKHTTVGYRSLSYDVPMIWYSLQEHVTNAHLKRASDRLIEGNIQWWEAEEFLGINIPFEVKKLHIDLSEPQPNAFVSLKSLNGRMHGKQLQDLPFPPEMHLTHEQMDIVANYCLHSDLDATHNLWNALREPMELRRALGGVYNRNFMSKSDSQIGEAIVKTRVEEITGRKVKKVETKPGTTFKYPIPDWVSFRTQALQELLERVRETEFVVKSDGKTASPKWMATEAAQIKLGTETYQFGIGGIHTTESNRATFSTDTHILIDADVASQYPAAILMLGLYPRSLGPEFLEAYDGIRRERLAAKKRAKEIEEELPKINDPDRIAALNRELEECKVKDKGGKIQLNGVYGKLGSRYSILYAPHLLLSVTLTCQLAILMLVERALEAGINVVSGNTDGVLFQCPREMYDGLAKDRLKPSVLQEVCAQWEADTGFDLEFGEYKAIYNQSVNSYFAIKMDGKHKRKGPLGNPWNPDKSDFDPVRGQLMKNPQMTICSDAALARIKHGTPIEETIRACRDIRQFVTVIKAANGATWRGQYLGKAIRYYWSTDGDAIYDTVPHDTTGNFKKIPKTDGAAECMRLPDDFPEDIDYRRYIEETETILSDLGFYGPKPPKLKRIRLTKANRETVLRTWMVAA
ncbi:hypothetical protein [Agrobacterium tumefaciens]|uniref:hypothetical protein n=1 Tax=Agrobacterium tumefaciens TaxID=358 RepID=UPI0016592C45|nr:hypothetical protein [Agrobacterium tumefaciens]QNP78433.1 hypothetical protein IAI05_07675 [Agrobacterium tumefaciens]